MKWMQCLRRVAAVLAVSLGVFQPMAALGQKLLSEGTKDLATQIVASVSKEQKRKIAVIPFRQLDGRATVLGTYLAEELITNLFNAGNLEIVERSMLDKILSELKLGQSGAIDPNTAKQVGRVAGVDAIVTGTITDLQSYVALNCRLIDAQTGKIFAAAQTKIVKDDDLKKIMSMSAPGQASPSVDAPQAAVERPLEAPQENQAGLPSRASSAKSKPVETDRYRLIVESLRRSGGRVILGMRVEAVSDRTLKFRLCWGGQPPYLIDDEGNRWDVEPSTSDSGRGAARYWGGRGTSHDTAGLCENWQELLPGTKMRTQFTFASKESSRATTFTLSGRFDDPNHRGEEQYVISNLKVQ